MTSMIPTHHFQEDPVTYFDWRGRSLGHTQRLELVLNTVSVMAEGRCSWKTVTQRGQLVSHYYFSSLYFMPEMSVDQGVQRRKGISPSSSAFQTGNFRTQRESSCWENSQPLVAEMDQSRELPPFKPLSPHSLTQGHSRGRVIEFLILLEDVIWLMYPSTWPSSGQNTYVSEFWGPKSWNHPWFKKKNTLHPSHQKIILALSS